MTQIASIIPGASIVADETSLTLTGSTMSVKALGITAAKIAAGTITNTEISASAAIAFSKITASGLWTLVAEANPSAVQNYDFTGLAGDTEDGYILEFRIKSTNANNLLLRMNGATVAGSRQYIYGQGATAAAARDTTMAMVLSLANGNWAEGIYHFPSLKSGAGNARGCIAQVIRLITATNNEIQHISYDITTPAVGTQITSIGIGADTDAAGIAAGSVLRLWKRVL